jgi:hypothetical protein
MLTRKNFMSLYIGSLVKRAKYLYLLIMAIGLLLSALVYTMANTVKNTSTELVEQRLPALSDVSHVAMLVSEQERILYEYYATTNVTPYREDYQNNLINLSDLLTSLLTVLKNQGVLKSLQKKHEISVLLSKQLDQNLSSVLIDWDLAREQLKQISATRRAMLPLMGEIENQIKQSVEAGYVDTIFKLNTTVWLVVLFSLGLIIFTFYLGRYAMRYIELSAENGRLARFPQRNPNPIFSLDVNANVTYTNPAAKNLSTHLLIAQQ